jgi:hypothetical protein
MGLIGSMIAQLFEKNIRADAWRFCDACSLRRTGTCLAHVPGMSRLATFLSVGVVALSVMVAGSADAQPKKKKPTAAEMNDVSAEFDRQAASSAITEVNLGKCKATNAARGEGHVTITFGTDGAAQSAQIDKGPWLGTPTAKCMIKEFKKAKIPAFRGEAVTVGKTFHFD